MTSLLRALKPLKTAATAFFSHDLTLRRGARGLELALAERPSDERLSPAQRQARDRRRHDAELLAQMRADLSALLDEGENTRRTMRALVMFEQALAAEGLAALASVPLAVLGKALEQFESLVSNWSAVGLATLRSKMAVAARQRRDAEAGIVAATGASTGRAGANSLSPRVARDSGPSVSVGMQESRQDLAAADVQEVELDVAAQLAAAYSGAAAPALPHPQAPTAADDEAAALAAAYAALGSGITTSAPESIRG
jgi:hypothetical protein